MHSNRTAAGPSRRWQSSGDDLASCLLAEWASETPTGAGPLCTSVQRNRAPHSSRSAERTILSAEIARRVLAPQAVRMSVLGTPVKHAGNRVEVRGSTVQVIDLDVPLEELTTDPDPMPELYELVIDEAAVNGRPTVIHFSSPEHCINELCEPVLQEIKASQRTYGDRVDFIHIESRAADDPTTLSATAKIWGLPSEPWTFIVGKRGRVNVRAEGPLDRVELGLLLDRELQRP